MSRFDDLHVEANIAQSFETVFLRGNNEGRVCEFGAVDLEGDFVQQAFRARVPAEPSEMDVAITEPFERIERLETVACRRGGRPP